VVTARRAKPDAALFAGRGKVAEIAARREATGADLVIFDHALSGVQQRNLERALGCRVVDRIALILDISPSGRKARKASCRSSSRSSSTSRRDWSAADAPERQKGGIGLRGPGETQPSPTAG
jgi:GTP-binding protein HflX